MKLNVALEIITNNRASSAYMKKILNHSLDTSLYFFPTELLLKTAITLIHAVVL